MASEDLTIRLGLKGQQQVARGLREVKDEAKGVGDAVEFAGAKAQMMGAKFSKATDHASLGIGRLVGAFAIFQGAQGLGRLTVATTKWGLSFNSQVEQARLRFQLFTTDVDGLTNSVKAIDRASMFNFADLADAAALLGGSGIKDVPKTLQAAANAAAGGGKGTEGLKSIVLALSQIQSKGRLSQEEVNQLTEGGAITAQRDLSKGLHLTAKELQNLGGQGIEANKALDVLTRAWTSGKMAGAAKRQLNTLSGQWGMFTGTLQKDVGLLTEPLAHDLERTVIPAANRAADQINKIFGKEGLSNEEKMRQARAVIKRELGPIGDDLKQKLDEAKIPEHLGELVGAAVPFMAGEAAKAAPHVAKAFVDGWMHSGPWAQIATLLFIAKKGVDVGNWARGGKGGKGRGALAGSGQTPLNPLYVWVVGEGMASVLGKKGLPGKAKDLAKTLGPAALAGARTAAIPAAGEFAPAFAPLTALGWLAITQGHHNLPTRGAGASSPSNPKGSLPAPGFGGGMPGLPPGGLTVKVVVNDREVATANARGNAKQRARN